MEEPGSRPLVIAGGTLLNVYTSELLPATITLMGDRIVAVEPGTADPPAGVDVVDARGLIVAPGYVDPHAHLGMLVDPVAFLEKVVTRGTTCVMADTYPFLVSARDDGVLGSFLDHLHHLPVRVYWFLAPHARSHLEGESEVFSLERLQRIGQRPDVVGLGEVTRWPDVERGEPDLREKLLWARRAGKRVEGHAPGASPGRLATLSARGFTSCHEAITAEEVIHRLRFGLYVMLRYSSIRPDLPQLAAGVTGDLVGSNRIMLTPDGPTPVWLEEHGYVDAAIRVAIGAGIPAPAAYRMATLNPASYYRVEHEVGAVAPGRRADLVLLRRLDDPTPEKVFAGGRLVAEDGRLVAPFPRLDASVRAGFRRRPGHVVPVEQFAHMQQVSQDGLGAVSIHLDQTVITHPASANGAGMLAALVDWEGKWAVPSVLSGFAEGVGGLVSTFNPAFELVVLGESPADMALASRRAIELGGGLVLAESGRVLWELPLSDNAWMSDLSWSEVVTRLREFEGFLRQRGYAHLDPAYSLFFLAFDTLPQIRLTPRGVWQVKAGRVLREPVRLS